VRIGRGAIIGANSVVTCSVPDGEIWAGIPARKVGVR
jgi:serine O-acetyltransferase